VLLYDAECGLCNRCVRVLLRVDRAGRLRYAALGSAVGQGLLRRHSLPAADFDTLVFVAADDTVALRTDGVLGALAVVGGAGRLFLWLRWVPRAWRDAGYRLIARWRYALWGEWRPRPLARPEWTRRFLDGAPSA
jgi:predicted DCC family thiol-disulfide oxidoreductase YuxK